MYDTIRKKERFPRMHETQKALMLGRLIRAIFVICVRQTSVEFESDGYA